MMGGVSGKTAASPLSLMSVFKQACPIYISYGMTYEQFWDGDVEAHAMYREAKKYEMADDNRNLWLQGMYIYEALLAVGRYTKAFSKAKPAPYAEHPYDLFAEEKKRRQEKEKRAQYERMIDKVHAFATAFNEKRREKETEIKEGVDDIGRCES